MSRMTRCLRTPRSVAARAAVGALSATLLLGACTSDPATPEGTADSGAVASGASIDEPTATKAINDGIAAANAAWADTSDAGAAARQKAFRGSGLESADAIAKTWSVKSPAQRDAILLEGKGTPVAVSRGTGFPRQIIANAPLKTSGSAALVLFVQDAEGEPYKIEAVTPMLTGATLEGFDPVAQGSAAIPTSGLAAQPDAVLTDLASSMAYPKPAEAKLVKAGPFSDSMRATAAEQGKTISAQGVFTQSHNPEGVIGGLSLKTGSGALVFGSLTREDSIAMRNAVNLTPSKDFTLLTGVAKITREAELTSSEVVAIVIPTSGPATVVAASDQLVGGSAS